MARVAKIEHYPTFTNEDNKLTISLKSKHSDKHQQMAAFIDQISKSYEQKEK